MVLVELAFALVAGEVGRVQPVAASRDVLTGLLEDVCSDGQHVAVVAKSWIGGQLLERGERGVGAVDHPHRRYGPVELDNRIGPELAEHLVRSEDRLPVGVLGP